MAAVKFSDVRALVRFNVDDPVQYNEIDLGIAASQQVYPLPTRPVVALSDVVSIDGVAKTRVTDYAILNHAGQLYFAAAPTGSNIHVLWQFARWSDEMINQYITESVRYMSTRVPKRAKTTRTVIQADVDALGWATSVDDLGVYAVRWYDAAVPLGQGNLWTNTPFWHWDRTDQFLSMEGTFLVGDQFQVLSRRRWADPSTSPDQMDPGTATATETAEAWPVEMNDPCAWLAASMLLDAREPDRDMAGLEGAILDNQTSPAGSFNRAAAFYRAKFDAWLKWYARPWEMRTRRPSVL
jgi:hypothetical protein